MDAEQADRIARTSVHPAAVILGCPVVLMAAGCPAGEADRLTEQLAGVDHRPYSLAQVVLAIALVMKEGTES